MHECVCVGACVRVLGVCVCVCVCVCVYVCVRVCVWPISARRPPRDGRMRVYGTDSTVSPRSALRCTHPKFVLVRARVQGGGVEHHAPEHRLHPDVAEHKVGHGLGGAEANHVGALYQPSGPGSAGQGVQGVKGIGWEHVAPVLGLH
jgi:hypothetical protein